PPAWLLILLIVAPPLTCSTWYLVWRSRNPDAARLIRRRRSRAAQQAMRALQAVDKIQTGMEASSVAETLAVYLCLRLDFPAQEPTPAEVAAYLEGKGFSATLAEQVASVFRACDVARFAPKPILSEDHLQATAVNLILSMESEPCSSHPF